MKRSEKTKSKRPIASKIEDIEAQVAFAEAGELYPHNPKKLKKSKEGKAHVCVEGETSSGLCTECGPES